jgi:glycerate kinase
VEAAFGVAGELGILDVASACGLALIPPERRNPLYTTTRGVGELILAALGEGCRHIVVGLGGSATCDGGEGMLSVPGLRSAASGVRLTVLCDVDTPFIGPSGAARVFGPQKGASPSDVEALEQRMTNVAARLRADTGVDVRSVPGAGAAGGLGGAFLACFGAELVSGVEEVLRLTGFDQAIAGADLIVTGEGRSDRQTLAGKVPYGVLQHASGNAGIPVALLSGRIEDPSALLEAGFRHLVAVSPPDLPLAEALCPSVAAANLRRAATRLLKAQ